MKIFLKVLGIILGILVVGLLVLYLVFNEKKPEGIANDEADKMANTMLLAIDKPAWDTTEAVQWTFKDVHTFLWDKKRHYTRVEWDDYKVLVNINEQTGKAWKGGEPITDAKETQKLVTKAWKFWANDSFWLNAPAKAFDPGTTRSLVDYDGQQALMVSYASGGVTPGDSYLWFLGDDGLPTSWKMWVKIIPVGGVGSTWGDWITLSTGAKIAQTHSLGSLSLPISNVKGTHKLEELESPDPFAGLDAE